MRLEDYLNEIESWIEQVEDEEVDPEDYDFIDRVVHKGRDGNNGLGQVGAYLAVYERDGEVQTDDELIEVLEERQAELPQGGRNRFSNIIYGGQTEKREENNLLDKARRGDAPTGHERLETMIEAAREHMDLDTEVQETQYPDGKNPRTNKTGVTIQLTQGDKTMTLDETYDDAAEVYVAVQEGEINSFTEFYQHVEMLDDEELGETEEAYLEFAGTATLLTEFSRGLANESRAMLNEKYRTDEFVESIVDRAFELAESYEDMKDEYVEDLEEATVNALAAGHRVNTVRGHVEEATENLTGLNTDMSEALSDLEGVGSEVDDLRDFKRRLDAPETSEE